MNSSDGVSLLDFKANFDSGAGGEEAGGYKHGWQNVCQSGGTQMEIQKNIEHFCGLNWQL